MTRQKRAASDNEDLQEVQKRPKTRGQAVTGQRAEEEPQDLGITTRGIFRPYSFALLNRTHH